MEYHFHNHKGRRRGGRDHLREILQCCSDDQEQQTGQGQGVIKQEGAVAACKAEPFSVSHCLLLSVPWVISPSVLLKVLSKNILPSFSVLHLFLRRSKMPALISGVKDWWK